MRINGGGGSQTIAGLQNDTAGEFWQFYAEALRPDTVYELRLEEAELDAMEAALNAEEHAEGLAPLPPPPQGPPQVAANNSCVNSYSGASAVQYTVVTAVTTVRYNCSCSLYSARPYMYPSDQDMEYTAVNRLCSSAA